MFFEIIMFFRGNEFCLNNELNCSNERQNYYARNEFCKNDELICSNDGENYMEIIVKMDWIENGCPKDLKSIKELNRKDPSKKNVTKESFKNIVRNVCKNMDNINKKVSFFF